MATGIMNPLTGLQIFWPIAADKPSLQCWLRWKTTFQHQMTLFPVLHPNISLSESHWIMLFRQYLGEEGQRHFDALKLMEKPSIAEAIASFEKLWGVEQNVYTARYHLFKLQQRSGEGINDFISRIHQAIPECRYTSVEPHRFEETMQIQCLIGGVTDDQARERLLSEDAEQLTWERACNIARQREHLKEQLATFNKNPCTESVHVLHQAVTPQRPKPPPKKFACYRCGGDHATPNECPHQRTKCRNCGKFGHLARVCRSRSYQSTINTVGLNSAAGSPNQFKCYVGAQICGIIFLFIGAIIYLVLAIRTIYESFRVLVATAVIIPLGFFCYLISNGCYWPAITPSPGSWLLSSLWAALPPAITAILYVYIRPDIIL